MTKIYRIVVYMLTTLLFSSCATSPHYEKQVQFEVVRCYAEKMGDVWGGITYDKMECFYHTSIEESVDTMEQLYPSKKISKVCVSGDDLKRCLSNEE